ncbi:MFS general substrate transporter [Athelia psychrophila]|uniref:MFS general substrate transporter n=1 Tax=Athelia psychrophila TaxID=1759441 RepID=A0A167UCP7_9AGAM|nr:MFS general substrate transporter [Fibularhizoctonia sp. CBS 109695]
MNNDAENEKKETMPMDGEGESAIPEDPKLEAAENAEEDWAHALENPRNWPSRKKWVSFYTFVTPLGSSMMAPALPEIAEKFGITNPTIIAMTLSVFLISFAFGPLFLAPLSEMYGRTWVLHIANVIFLAFNLGCAFSTSSNMLIGFRFLSGWAGAAPIAIGGGSVGDLFSERERAGAMALYSLGPLIGPVVGPIAGGFIAQSIGVKYVFIVIAGLCGIAGLIGVPFLHETYAPVIRVRLAQKMTDPEEAQRRHPAVVQATESKARILWLNLSRPAMMLTRSFICFILSLYMALMYGIYYLLFATFPDLFAETYHFSEGIGGLAYIGLGVGFITATLFGAKVANTIYTTLADRNGGKGTPEMRIPALIFGSLFVPVGLFWFGWSAEAKLHWIMPIIGTGIFGFGLMTTFLPIQLYLVDSFTYAASALSAAAVFRSLLGFAFPLFGSQMYAALGVGGGNSLLAGLAIVIGIPFPIWIRRFGPRALWRGEAGEGLENRRRRDRRWR